MPEVDWEREIGVNACFLAGRGGGSLGEVKELRFDMLALRLVAEKGGFEVENVMEVAKDLGDVQRRES